MDKSVKKNGDEPKEFEVLFKLHAKSPDGISLENTKKWMKQGNIIGDKSELKDADVDQSFKTATKDKKVLDLNGFREFLQTLSTEKKMQKKELMDKLIGAGKPK